MSITRSAEFSRGGPFLVLAVTALILFFARDLLVPFAFALTLAFLLAPAVSRLETRRVPPVLAVAITGVLAFTIIGGVGYVVARQLLNVARDLPAYRLSIQKKIASVHSPAEQSLEKAFTAVEDISGDLATSAGNATPRVKQPLAQAQPVRVVDPDRTQLQSTVEFLMRFLRPIAVSKRTSLEIDLV
jgi:predicted PurR-regulated permease PerM